MYEKTYPSKRFNITLDFLKKHIKTSETIFDLGATPKFTLNTGSILLAGASFTTKAVLYTEDPGSRSSGGLVV